MCKRPSSDPRQQRIKIDNSSIKGPVGIADILVQNQLIFNLFGNQKSSPRQGVQDWRSILIGRVKEEVEGIIKYSLHNQVLINLHKEMQPQQVQRPWDIEVKARNQPSKQLPPETKIVEVFDEVKGKLLILGAPGAGKTITMLEIVSELITRAETYPAQPIPVFLNLSSWKKEQDIASWLLEQLNSKDKYSIPKDIAQRWLEERQLIPLLDGLDELESTRQGKCVKEINNFLSTQRPLYMVICSRNEEYQLHKNYHEIELNINDAIFIKPLNNSQIQTYLEEALGLSEIWKIIENNSIVLNLAKSPFLLNIMIFADINKEISFKEWRQLNSEEEALRRLFNAYIDRMIEQPIRNNCYPKNKQPTPNQTKTWLAWLATTLQAREFSFKIIKEKGFLIESIQPSLLQHYWQKCLYSILKWIVYGTLGGMFLWILFLVVIIKISGLRIYQLNNTSFIAIGCGILVGIIGLISGIRGILRGKQLSRKFATLVVALIVTGYFITIFIVWYNSNILLLISTVRNQLFLNILYSLFAGIFIVLSSGICGGVYGLICSVFREIFWLFTLLIDKLTGSSLSLPKREIRPIKTFSEIKLQRIKKTTVLRVDLMKKLQLNMVNIRESLILMGFYNIYISFTGKLIVGLNLTTGVLFGLAFWLYFELSIRIEALICQRNHGFDQEQIIISKRFIDRLILGQIIGIACANWFGPAMYLAVGIMFLLLPDVYEYTDCTRLEFVSPFKYTISLSLSELPLSNRIEANQEIWRAAFNAGFYALISSLVVGFLTGLLLAKLIGVFGGLLFGLLTFGLMGGLIVGLLLGGRASIQHFVLRVILRWSGSIPWNYARFLNYATERMLLQRIGGRYQFIHDLLQKHFAAMKPER